MTPPASAGEAALAVQPIINLAKDRVGRHAQQKEKLLRQLEMLLSSMEQQERENERLRNRMAYLQSGLDLLDDEQALQLRQRALNSLRNNPGRPMPMLQSDNPLAAPTPPSLQQEVSVHGLPEHGCWDPAWEHRTRCLTPRDAILLFRQITRGTAVLLPRAEQGGPGSPDHQRLLSLMDKYLSFSQHALSLAPGAWSQRARYNLETLEPLEAPPKEYFHDLLSQYSHLTCLFQHCEQYATKARQLRQEYQALGQRHLQLTGQAPAAFGLEGPSLAALESVMFDRMARAGSTSTGSDTSFSYHQHYQQGGFSQQQQQQLPQGGFSHEQQQQYQHPQGGFSHPQQQHYQQQQYHQQQQQQHYQLQQLSPCSSSAMSVSEGCHAGTCEALSPEGLQLEEVLSRMQGNLWKQRMALKQCLRALWQGLREKHCTEVARFYLLAYPVPLNIVDYLDALVASSPRSSGISTAEPFST